MGIIKSPVVKKRIARFKEQKSALVSLLLIIAVYSLSLFAELFCNSSPLYVQYNDSSFFPVFKFYSEDTFLGNGKQTRPDYKKMNQLPVFRENEANYMIFPVFKYGPLESVDPSSLASGKTIELVLSPVERVGHVNIRKDYSIRKSASFSLFTNSPERELKGTVLSSHITVSKELEKAVEDRFNNIESEKYSEVIVTPGGDKIVVALSTYSKRSRQPKTVRIKFRDDPDQAGTTEKIVFNSELGIEGDVPPLWDSVLPGDRAKLLLRIKKRYDSPVDPFIFFVKGNQYQATFDKQDVRFPHRPVEGHVLGIDGAGRDVFARIFYGLRISVSFGLLLVFFSMLIGISAGAVQGYFGGKTDITAQRFIEIWSALPFLYIMILMGAVYGRSFVLLLFCYGIFNWIGISYYVRAEFLRLRKKAFVEAAQCMGTPAYKIIFRHIMPNAMIPVITFFPFSLVGAIGALAALDYLGFGLPPPTPSWGELFFQAQQYRWAWWLILYPALALFFVMLAGVFVGDGVRNAYDPKKYTRLE